MTGARSWRHAVAGALAWNSAPVLVLSADRRAGRSGGRLLPLEAGGLAGTLSGVVDEWRRRR